MKIEMEKPHLSIQNLNVYYDANHVLKNISIEIPRKKITAIIGPSGCGKSTLLRSINRILELGEEVKIEGHIYLDGIDVLSSSDLISIRRKIGFLSQKPCPLPMSIYENVAYGPRIHGMRDVDEKVVSCLKAAGLWDEVKHRLNEPASKLSTGQQQRLCLARALAVEPEILLADEPTSALDPISAQHIENQLLRLKKNYTIVIVTHNIHQAIRLADYVIFIYLGEIVEHGEAKTVFRTPKQQITRAYINGETFEIKIDRELNLKGKICPYNFVESKLALEELEIGQTLKIIVDYKLAVTEVPRAMEFDGHKVLSIKQLNETDWEIVIQKQR
jgi:phosphate transport system ATP-binding protein